MSSMAIRIWIALNFLTVFFAVFFVAFLSASLRQLCNVVQGVCNKGCKGVQGVLAHSELLQPFCILMAHFASLAEAAIILPLLGNFVAVTSFPCCPPSPHPALFRNVLLPRQFMLLSSARPRLKDLQRQPICQMWHTHTHTHTCSCNTLPHQYRDGCRGWGAGTPTHTPLSYTQCTKLKMTKQNCENCENLLHRISALCSTTTSTSPRPYPHLTLHVACSMPPGVGSRQHQAGRTWNHFLACWHCKILISILMSNCRLV